MGCLQPTGLSPEPCMSRRQLALNSWPWPNKSTDPSVRSTRHSCKSRLKPHHPPISISIAPPPGCRPAVFRSDRFHCQPVPDSRWRRLWRSRFSIRHRGLSPVSRSGREIYFDQLGDGLLDRLVLITSTVSSWSGSGCSHWSDNW